MMRVVGPRAELAAVDRALDRARAGSAAIMISGGPGIGKSTVWRYGIAGAVARSYRVVSCRPACWESWLAFCGLADLLEEVPADAVDGLPDPQREALEASLLKRAAPQPDADHQAISTAVTGVIRGLAAAGPVVLAIDDLQWLDKSTTEVLAHVLRRLSREPVLFLGAARDGAGEAPSALGRALDEDRVTRVRLRLASSPATRGVRDVG